MATSAAATQTLRVREGGIVLESSARRSLLKAAALTPAAAVIPMRLLSDATTPAQAYAPSYAEPASAVFFTLSETAFIDAAVARIVPSDELGPGAKEAGATTFIDRQLAGPYGSAETWYMDGPWQQGEKEQGYQLKLTPAQLYRLAIREIDDYVRKTHAGKSFAQIDAAAQDDLLHRLEKDDVKLPNAPASTFMTFLVSNTVEGLLADPVYGGNRDFIGWKLIGFPGPRYNYVAEIDQYGKAYDMPFVSIAGRDTGVSEG